MVALTIVLVGSVGFAATTLVDSSDTNPPSARFQTDRNGSTVRITHIGGDSIEGTNLEFRGATATFPKTVDAGTTITAIPTTDHVQLIWRSDDGQTSVVLLELSPERTGNASLFTVSDLTVANGSCSGGTATGSGTVTVTNEGSIEDTQTITLTVDGKTVREKEVTLAPGEQTEVTFDNIQVQTTDCEVDVVVSSENDQASTTVPGFGAIIAVLALIIGGLLKKHRE